MSTFDAVEVIKTKRDGRELSDAQIRGFIAGYADGAVADEQAAALLMAIVWRGLSVGELATWTAAMIASGQRLDLSGVGRPTVDKHSTGGVGDKVSLPLVPIVAACGAAVPQLSGRGLGHTGGTLDKMESIPGWRAELAPAEMLTVLRRVGGVICAAGPAAGLAPADGKLYALRDVTGTVESIPLIASSIMAKKIAEGTSALVLDVKVGGGAFMADIGQARLLAETMVQLGAAHGVRTSALLTAMDAPLGRAVGNAIEVTEALSVLRGGGPEDLVTLTVALAREMLALAGIAGGGAEAGTAGGGAEAGTGGGGSAGGGAGDLVEAVRRDGRALATWRAMVAAQSGDPDAALPQATASEVIRAPATGYVTRLDARAVGNAVWRLGAGRARKEHRVSATAGIWCRAKPGEWVEAGQPVLELAVDDATRVPSALDALAGAFTIGPEPPEDRPLILDRIGP
ncbi:MAG: thymidine phosphorylase [Acidimicrobiaceae bacterium]|nr:thymidine phosphorylase [Acidimicrobiaceae bacterium]